MPAAPCAASAFPWPAASGAALGLLVVHVCGDQNHVLSSQADADQADIVLGRTRRRRRACPADQIKRLAPGDAFFTGQHPARHYAGKRRAFFRRWRPTRSLRHLPLLPLSGKGLDGEWVTIIQHPGGMPKQMAVRACRIVELDEGDRDSRFIHTTTDTEPGSSGAPVLNDQWQVVQIRRQSDPPTWRRDRKRLEEDREPENGSPQPRHPGISAISSLLQSQRFTDRDAAGGSRAHRAGAWRSAAPASPSQRVFPRHAGRKRSRPPRFIEAGTMGEPIWTGRYDLDFIPGHSFPIQGIIQNGHRPHPEKCRRPQVRTICHFSTAVYRDRKFPLLTAVNIRGDKAQHPGDREGKFRTDIRMDED